MYECWIQLRNELIFEAAPWNLEERCESVCRRYRKRYKNAPEEERREAGQLLKELAVDLCSYLPRWNMKDVSRFVLESGSKRLLETAAELGGQELVSQAEEEKAAFADSRLIQMTELKENKKSGTAWGNDNALGIMECMRKGASFVTTNPPIVNTARKEKPEEFDRVRDEINRRYPDEPVEKRVSRFTLEAVLNNCRALRSVYRLTGAKEGYVNYQVNPKNFEDSEKMIQEIEFAYEELSRRLNGKPNVDGGRHRSQYYRGFCGFPDEGVCGRHRAGDRRQVLCNGHGRPPGRTCSRGSEGSGRGKCGRSLQRGQPARH